MINSSTKLEDPSAIHSGVMSSDIGPYSSCFCFVDLEKAFDRLPREVIIWAINEKNSVRAQMSQRENSKNHFRFESL